MGGFTDVGELAQQSQGAWDAMTDSIRKRDAYNALRKTYGPIAGDPVNALRMQSYGYNDQMNPLQIANQQIVNQGRQQQQDYLEKSYPLQLQRQGEEVTQAQQQTQLGELSLNGQKALHVRAALGGTLADLGQNDPGDPNARGTAFDQSVARSAQLLGTDPAALGQELAQQRQAYVTGGASAVPDMQKQLDTITLGSMNPADRALYMQRQQAVAASQQRQKLIDAQIQTQEARTGLVKAQTGAVGAKAGGKQASATAGEFTAKRMQGVTGTMDTSDPNRIGFGDDGAIGRALKYLDQSSDSPTYRGLVEDAAKIPFVGRAAAGTPEYQLQQEIDQIAHNLPLDDLRTLKEMGGNLGRVTNVEFMALKDAIQNLNTARSKPDLRRALVSIGNLYAGLQKNAEPAAKTGADSSPAPVAAPADAGAAPPATPTPGPAAPAPGPQSQNILPPGSGEQAPSTAQGYQPQTGAPPAAAGPPAAAPGAPGQVQVANADALSAPVSGPGAATPAAPQVDWEHVLPYLPELLAMARERKASKRG